MGNDAKGWHTKKAVGFWGDVGILNQDGKIIAEVFVRIGREAEPQDAEARAAFIVRACSAHDALVAACEKMIEWLNHAPVDYKNGVVAPSGADEGNVLGWMHHWKLANEIQDVIADAKGIERPKKVEEDYGDTKPF